MRKFVAAVLACASLVLGGCADMITGGPLIREGEPTGVIQVANAGQVDVSVVMISNCDASTYGLNRLPEGVTIPPGRYYEFTVSAGCWDVDAGYGIHSTSWAEARQRMQVNAGGGVRYIVH